MLIVVFFLSIVKKNSSEKYSKELFIFFKFERSEYGVNMIVIPEMSH